MSEDKLPSEYEIEAAIRMARETMDSFAGLAISLRPGEARRRTDGVGGRRQRYLPSGSCARFGGRETMHSRLTDGSLPWLA
jgi:hypothetical protein